MQMIYWCYVIISGGRKAYMHPGGGNCSVSDTINTLGGGPDVSKTLSTINVNTGALFTSIYSSKGGDFITIYLFA